MSLKRSSNSTHSRKNFNPSVGAGGLAAPVITSITICDSSYNNLDDTALDPAGSYVKLNGTGFQTGCSVYFNNQSLTATFISSSEVRIQTPVITAGSYNLMLFNPNDNGGAIYLNLSVSNFPSWTTSAGSLGSVYEQTAYANTIVATGDTPLVYSVLSGTLPSGITLSSGGVLSGTTPVDASSTTYTFVANVKDAQGQDSTRTFTLTINVDTVTWNTPTQNYVISSYEYSPISNVTANATSAAGFGVLYSPNTLPSGISTNTQSGLISGTINTVGNYYTRYTATANTSGRSATRDVVFNVNQDVVTFSNPSSNNSTITLAPNIPMTNVVLAATSAAGFGVQYSVTNLPTGVSLSNGTISGTPTSTGTSVGTVTATANTTNRATTWYINWTISIAVDTYFANTTLLLSANTQTPSFITDTSNNNTQLTVVGDTRASNYNPYQTGYYSNYMYGQIYSALSPASTNFNLTGDFTLEAWVYPTNLPAGDWGVLDARVNGGTSAAWCFGIQYSGKMQFFDGTARLGTTVFTPGKWYHLCWVRNGSVLRGFVNGIMEYYNASYGTSAISPGSTSPSIGTKDYGISGFGTYGHISNLRLVNGTAVYTTAATTVGTQVFTPSVTPLTSVANTVLLTCQSNRYIDNSPNNFSITPSSATSITISPSNPFSTIYQANTQYYSTYFDGTGDYLTVPNDASLAFGTGDFTIELWFYNQAGTNKGLFHLSSGYLNSSTSTLSLAVKSTSQLTLWYGSGTQIDFSSTQADYKWHHVAVVRTSGTIKVYTNGVETYSAADTTNYTYNYLAIGGYYSTSFLLTGNISNFRVLKGTALYTTAFTPPNAPLTAIANTSLLTCQSNRLIDNSNTAFTITGNGDAKPVASSPFTPLGYTSTSVTTLGSAYLDGTGDYLSMTIPALGTGDFTIEGWAYNTSDVVNKGIFHLVSSGFPSSITGLGLAWFTTAGGFNLYYANGSQTNAGANPITNTWYHFAVVRISGTVKVYINGSLYISTADTTNYTATNMLIGGYYSTSYLMTGYISDFRVIKGTGLYTSNFAPQFTNPLTAVANTSLLTAQTNRAHNNSTFKDESSFTNVINRVGNATNGTFSPYGDNWSCYFDGSGDYLTTSSFSLTLATWTMEMWINTTSTTQYQTFVHRGNGASWSVTSIFDLYQTGTTNSSLTFLNGTGGVSMSGTSVINDGKWHHVALTYDGTNYRMFIDGKLEAYQSGSAMSTASYLFYIGYDPRNARYTTGNISNFRFVDGTVVYSTSSTTTGTQIFDVPTAPLTAVANTALLVCNTNRFIDFSAKNSTITKSGDISIQKFSPFNLTTTPKYHSTYFNGTDYLQTPASSATSIIGGTGAITTTSTFTIECWIYQTTRQSDGHPIVIGDMGTNGSVYWSFGPDNNGKLAFYWYTGATNYSIGNDVIPLNRWTHIAVSIDSGAIKLFVNGNLQTITGPTSTSNQTGTFGYLLSGLNGSGGSLSGYYGHISNLRIVKSALYSTTFTPSTSPLTAVANTGLLICQDNTIKDNSTNNLLITSGTTTVKPLPVSPFTPTANTGLSYSPSTLGASVYLDGTGDYLTVPHHPSQWLASNDFTIEFWLYTLRTGSEQAVIGKQWQGSQAAYGSFVIYIETGNTVRVLGSTSGSSWELEMASSTYVVKTNEWTHIALTRSGSTFRLFLNGVLDKTSTLSGTLNRTTDLLTIGAAGPQTGYNAQVYGWLSDIRMIVGKALYTSNFYPGLTPLTNIAYSNNSTDVANTSYASFFLNGTSGGIIDQTHTVNLETVGDAKVTNFSPYNGSYYSNYFDGTGDYLQVPANAALALTGDFTVEAWVYPTVINTFNMILGSDNGSSSDYLGIKSTSLEMAINTGLTYPSWSYSFTAGRWYHICVTRSGSTLTAYVNGTSLGGLSYAQQFLVSGVGVQVGRYGYASSPYYFTGNISNVRIVKGTAIAPPAGGPTSPVTAVSGTSLLTCQSNSFIDNSTNAFTITKNGDAAVKTFNPFGLNSGQSYYFDGTGDYLTIPTSPNMDFGTGDFTVEAWVNPTSLSADWFIASASGSGGFFFGHNSVAGGFGWGRNAVQWDYQPATTRLVNQWQHVAVTRSGTSMRLFVNGLQQGTTQTISTAYNMGTTSTTIGSQGSSYLMTGYISDLRITKGTARYTSNNTTYLNSSAPYIVK